jgi:hypothetical protein
LVGLAATAFLVVSRLNPAHSDQAPPEAPSTAADAGEPLPTGSPGTPATQQPATSVRSVPSTAADSTPATLQGPPPAVLPQTGPGLTRPGILLIASPASDGSFDVIERIRMASPVSVLTLRPAPVDQAGREFASASAAATQVQVSAGDQPVVVPGARVDATIDLSVAAVDEFELR